jgi:hypothetical protein
MGICFVAVSVATMMMMMNAQDFVGRVWNLDEEKNLHETCTGRVSRAEHCGPHRRSYRFFWMSHHHDVPPSSIAIGQINTGTAAATATTTAKTTTAR